MRLFLLFLILSLSVLACRREESIDLLAFGKCHISQNLDSTQISERLLGSWKWSKQRSFWDGKTRPADKNVMVNFLSDQTFMARDDRGILTSGTWKLAKYSNNFWNLELSMPNPYLNGAILFWNNQLLFNDSNTDGFDNLFNKNK